MLSFLKFLIKIFEKLHFWKLKTLTKMIYHKIILSKTDSIFKQSLGSIEDISSDIKSINKNSEQEKLPIFFFWWQGKNSMPIIPNLCYKSLIRHSAGHKVIFLDKDNIEEYINIPDYIYQKLHDGIISLTHFSDILRMGLLSKYGGLWCDATIYLTTDLPKIIFKSKFFPGLKHKETRKWCYHHIENGRWTEYFFGTCIRENLFVKVIYAALLEYWKNSNFLIDYFLIDYFIFKTYKTFKEFRMLINTFPENNFHNTCLRNIMNQEYNDDLWNKILKDTFVHKLSIKIPYNEKTSDGKRTFYYYFINNMLEQNSRTGNLEI